MPSPSALFPDSNAAFLSAGTETAVSKKHRSQVSSHTSF